MKLRKEETTAHSREVTQRERSHKGVRTHPAGKGAGEGFFPVSPHLLCCRHYNETCCTGSRSRSPRRLFNRHKSSSHGPRSKHEFIVLGSSGRGSWPNVEPRGSLSREWPETLEGAWPGTSLSFPKPPQIDGFGESYEVVQGGIRKPQGPIQVESHDMDFPEPKLSFVWTSCYGHRPSESLANRQGPLTSAGEEGGAVCICLPLGQWEGRAPAKGNWGRG